MNGLVSGLENGLAGGFLGFFCFFETFNRDGHPNVPAAENRLTAAGKAARHGKATIYRDLPTLADTFARCAKANSPVTENVSVVVQHETIFQEGNEMHRSFPRSSFREC